MEVIMIRAMFDCISEQRHASTSGRQFKLQAVTPKHGTPDADDPEVNAFWTATPSGTIDVYINNPDAYLEIGQRYYVDFTPILVTVS
jgi:hypothetical protein